MTTWDEETPADDDPSTIGLDGEETEDEDEDWGDDDDEDGDEDE